VAPKQAGLTLDKLIAKSAGSVIVAEAVAVQLLASETMTE